jgi:hypothetical protein
MHDGLFRIAGLTAAQRRLTDRLASSDFLSDEELAKDLLRLIAEQCVLPTALLPGYREDLFQTDKLKSVEASDLSPFARDVLRGLESGLSEVIEYRERLNASVTNALHIFLNSERRGLELRAEPQFERTVIAIMRRYDDAVSVIWDYHPALLEEFCEEGRIKVKRSVTRLDLDAAIPGAEVYVT